MHPDPSDPSSLDFDESGATSPAPSLRRADAPAISVTELNRRTRNVIEAKFELMWVSGEISNFTKAASGHWYFVLKDDAAQVRCVMFRNRASAIVFRPENGMQVDVRALPSLYEARGEFQLGVEGMRIAGLGALYEAYERLKAKLGAEGLFDTSRKRTLPAFPRRIGIVTSLQAAALRDVLTTLKRRAPMIEIFLYPAAVQGANAPQEIANSIDRARLRREVETLIICRGGGSIEDLWSFNAEVVARAIVRLQDETKIAVVSGVGHETDFTICDFVADLRAPTPTAAAEVTSPDIAQLRVDVHAARAMHRRAMHRALENAYQQLDQVQRRLLSPQDQLTRARERLGRVGTALRHGLAAGISQAGFRKTLLKQRLFAQRPDLAQQLSDVAERGQRLRHAAQHTLVANRASVQAFAKALQMLAPERVLERGYSIVECNGNIVRASVKTKVGDIIVVRLARGRLVAAVKSIDGSASLATSAV